VRLDKTGKIRDFSLIKWRSRLPGCRRLNPIEHKNARDQMERTEQYVILPAKCAGIY